MSVQEKKCIIEEAERVIESIKFNGRISLTTTQIRKFLSAVNILNNKVLAWKVHNTSDELSEELVNEIKYLKVKIIYQAGRERVVKEFSEKANIINKINNIGSSVKKYEEFARFMEAIVAYHKFAGGRD